MLVKPCHVLPQMFALPEPGNGDAMYLVHVNYLGREKNVNYLAFRFTFAIILSLAKVALKSPLVSTVDRFVLESVLILKKAQ